MSSCENWISFKNIDDRIDIIDSMNFILCKTFCVVDHFVFDIVVMHNVKLISHIVTLSMIFFALIVFLLLLLLKQYKVTSQFWKTWFMQVVFVKLIYNVTYLTIVVMKFNNKNKISKHFINTIRCFFLF